MVLAIVTAPDLIGTVYGAKWIPTVAPLRLLAAGFILVGLRLGIGPIFYTKDHPSFDIYLRGVRLVAVIAAVTATARFGLGGVSAAMSAVEGAVSVFGIYLACTLIELPIARVFSASFVGVWLAIRGYGPYWAPWYVAPIYYYPRGEGDHDCDDGNCGGRNGGLGGHHLPVPEARIGPPPGTEHSTPFVGISHGFSAPPAFAGRGFGGGHGGGHR
jgi:hypothetical protein